MYDGEQGENIRINNNRNCFYKAFGSIVLHLLTVLIFVYLKVAVTLFSIWQLEAVIVLPPNLIQKSISITQVSIECKAVLIANNYIAVRTFCLLSCGYCRLFMDVIQYLY